MATYSDHELHLLNVWREKAGGWRWLHYHSMGHYKKINARFTYSSIVLSTLAGAGGFSSGGTGTGFERYMSYIIGAVNVIIGLINSFQRFGKAAEKTELHASAAMQYAMLYRKLETELALTDDHRTTDLITNVRQEMDRLLSQSPSVPQKIVKRYNDEFPDVENKPDVCNGLGKPQAGSYFGVTRTQGLMSEIIEQPRSPFSPSPLQVKAVVVSTPPSPKESSA
jgi:hypothetical protein